MTGTLSHSMVMSGEDVARRAMQTPAQLSVSEIARRMKLLPQIDCPLDHGFPKGFYVRTIHVPAGTLVVSKIFKAEFPFFVSRGRVSIWVEGVGVKRVQAPYWGFTKPGHRRVIYHHDDVTLSTFHPNPNGLTDPDEIEKEIIYDPGSDSQVDIPATVIQQLKR